MGVKGVITPLGHLRRGGGGVIIPWVNLTVTGNGGRSQRAAGRKTASPPLPRTRKFCRSSSWRRPGSWIAEWMDRRVVRELSLLLVTLPPPNFAPPLIAFQQHP